MDWLSLEIRDTRASNPVRILIPKKVARLATRRNRLRRLIQEAVRLERSVSREKLYVFKALKDPGDVGLAEVSRKIDELWPGC